MTRKRFVKLLMANGYSRNMAQFIAQLEAGLGNSYKEAFGKYKRDGSAALMNDFLSPEIYSVINDVAESFGRIARAACAAAEAFVDAFVNALTNESSDHAQEDE